MAMMSLRSGLVLVAAMLLAPAASGLKLQSQEKHSLITAVPVAEDTPMLPKCYEKLYPTDLLNASYWCNAQLSKSPPPKKLQGLYWMKWGKHSDLIQDVAVCMSLGEWNPETHTMKFPYNLDHFIWKQNTKAYSLVATNVKTGMSYDFVFPEEPVEGKQDRCDILVKGSDSFRTAFWKMTSKFTGQDKPMTLLEKIDLTKPSGATWTRSTDTKGTPMHPEQHPHEYDWVRVVDGDGNVVEDTAKEMLAYFKQAEPQEDYAQFVRYTRDDTCADYKPVPGG